MPEEPDVNLIHASPDDVAMKSVDDLWLTRQVAAAMERNAGGGR